jgi:hypothetical protein
LTNSGGSSPTNHATTAFAAPRRKRFVLTGHSAALDPAVFAVRDDLADVELADRVFAPHYAAAMAYRVIAPTTAYMNPNSQGAAVMTLSIGDALDAYDLSAGWAWVRTAKGIGYVSASSIEPA